MVNLIDDISRQIAALFLDAKAPAATHPIYPLTSLDAGGGGAQELEERHLAWLKATGFRPLHGNWALLPDGAGIEGAVFGVEERAAEADPLAPGLLPSVLPAGDYHYAWTPERPDVAALAWALGSYAFRKYQVAEADGLRRLRLPPGVAKDSVAAIASAVWFARDLINTPANDLGPSELAGAVKSAAGAFGAACEVIVGDDLVARNFPLVHAVGRASRRAPRLIDMTWGETDAPKVTLVGKGICFDTGGLDIKLGSAMLLMKKDMGGAAAALALAVMIMSAKLPVRLRLIIPAAENAISGEALLPGDVVRSRAGLTVEIGNTDAEGRLVLADALALADEEAPDTLMTFATLTGAARIALGPDLPPLFSTDTVLAEELIAAGGRTGDPMWRLPFWHAYDALLESKLADLNNVSPEPFAGAIMAALFLRRFVKKAKRYAHFDIYGWTPKPQPGKPFGGEPQCARAVFEYLSSKSEMAGRPMGGRKKQRAPKR